MIQISFIREKETEEGGGGEEGERRHHDMQTFNQAKTGN